MNKIRIYASTSLYVISRIASKANLAKSKITPWYANVRFARRMVAAAALLTGVFLPIHAIAADYLRIDADTDTQPLVHTHDLAVVSLKAPKKVTLSSEKPTVVKTVKVTIQNRSPYIETIPDQNTLTNLVSLGVVPQSEGSTCSAPVSVLHAGKPQPEFPVALKPNKTLKLVFDVTFTCAVDPMKGSGHEDFYYIAQVDASALDGQEDVNPASDVCPRTPIPVVDGTPIDKGCGGKLTGKTLGGAVLSDIVVKIGGGGGGGASPIDDPYFPDSPLISWVNITAVNAQYVSATVVKAANRVSDVATTIGGQIFPSPPATTDLLSSHSKFDLFETAVVTGEPVTDTCALSGTVTVSGAPANDPVTLAVGDLFDLVFTACDDGDGYIIDGSFSLKVMELVGDSRTDVFRLRYLLLDMSLTVASGVDSYTGSVVEFSLAWDSLAFPVIVLTSGAVSLQLVTQDEVYSWSFGVQSLTVNADTSYTTTLEEARKSYLKSVFLGHTLLYETIVPLQVTDDQAPESGEILISGNGTVRIVIESSTIVRLEIDSDGDGTVDNTQFTTWASLQG